MNIRGNQIEIAFDVVANGNIDLFLQSLANYDANFVAALNAQATALGINELAVLPRTQNQQTSRRELIERPTAVRGNTYMWRNDESLRRSVDQSPTVDVR